MATQVLLRQAQRFTISGVLVTGLHVLFAVSLIRWAQVSPELANGLAFAAATIFSYVINTLWSFSSPLHGRTLIRFIVVSLLGLLLTVAVSGLAEFYGLNYWLGIACVVCTVPPVTFLLHRFWTYQADSLNSALEIFPFMRAIFSYMENNHYRTLKWSAGSSVFAWNPIGWLSILAGLFAFVVITGGTILMPEYVDWLMAGDPAANFLGWQFFRYSPMLQFPLGANPSYGTDLGNSIVYTDSIPLLALLFKPFNVFLPDQFQYIGLWVVICFALQAFFAHKLLARFTSDKWLSLIGSGFFLLAPACLWRLHGHFSLFGQWVLLAGLYLYFSSRFSLGWWIGLLSVTALIHAYLLVMVGVIWAADLWQRGWQRELKLTQLWLCFFAGGIFTVAIMWLAGYFMVGGGVGEGGFGTFRMNLLSLIDPVDRATRITWSRLIRDQPETSRDYEGFNYLGLGMLMLAVVASYELLRRPKIAIEYRSLAPILLISLTLTIFALSNHVALGSYELGTYVIPQFLESLANAFRSSGRMFWPVYYLIYLGLFYLVFSRLERRVAITVCTTLLVVQAADSSAALRHFRNKFSNPPKWSSPMQSRLWSDIGSRYKRIIYVLPRNAPDAFLPWAHFAAENRMTINFGFFARVDPVKLDKARKRVAASVIDNELDPEALYVFEHDGLWALASSQVAMSDMVGMLDGFRILAPGLKECSTCDRVAIGGVRTEGGLNYSTGERISFTQDGTSLKYAVLGWSGPEPWGTWSEDDASIVMLKLPSVPDGNLALRFEGHAFVTEKHPAQEIDLLVNGHLVETLRYSVPQTTETRAISIPRSLITDRLLRIEFRFKNPKSPQELGLSTDSRRLGLGLVSLQLEKQR